MRLSVRAQLVLLATATIAAAACGDVVTFTDAGVDATVDAAIDAIDAIDAPTTVCGDGVVEGTEACDLGAANGSGSCCSAQCTVVADGDACTAGGGSTCCAGVCSHTAQAGTCDACALPARGPQRIAIIESTSIVEDHLMDARWQAVATADGHTATVLPQTALDSLDGLADYDILIVSSGVITLPPERRAVIAGFAASQRGVYVQSEYLPSFTTNLAVAEIVAAHGGELTWTRSLEGVQNPTANVGCVATTPDEVPALTYYWWAATGTGNAPGLEAIQTAPSGDPVGWSYCLPGGGKVITGTDQDFIIQQTPGWEPHLRNVLRWLADAPNCDPRPAG